MKKQLSDARRRRTPPPPGFCPRRRRRNIIGGVKRREKCWKSVSNPTEDLKFSKKFACGGQLSIIHSSNFNGLDHCWKCAPIRRRSLTFKKFACGGLLSILSSDIVHCFVVHDPPARGFSKECSKSAHAAERRRREFWPRRRRL